MFIHPEQIRTPLLLTAVVAAVWFACAQAAFGSGPIELDEAVQPVGVTIKPAAAQAGPIVSQMVTVIDGDTMIVGGEHIRLWGVDAPEIEQICTNHAGLDWQCGLVAKQFLEDAIEGATIVCQRKNGDRYGRTVALCQYGAAYDIAAVMVSNGFALDWPKYSGGDYREQQSAAAEAELGVWSGKFVEPWTYRLQTERS